MEQIRDSAAETARRYGEAIILGIAPANWNKPTSTDTWLASFPMVPWLEKSDETIYGVNAYFVQTKFLKIDHPMEVLEGQLDVVEWQVASVVPEKGIRYHPEKGTDVMIDGRYVNQADTDFDHWQDIIEHLGKIAEYMDIEILD